MTSDVSESRGSRKFDDVASLFGSIVPPAGSTVRPERRMHALPTALPENDAPPVIPVPAAMPTPRIAPAAEAGAPAEGAASGPVAIAFDGASVGGPIGQPAPALPAAAPRPKVASPRAATVTKLPQRPAAARPRPTEIPWPDAFEPRPNFKKREPRNWSWLLLIPVGLIAAYGITVLDVRAIKGWVDSHVLGRTPGVVSDSGSLLPAPFRTGAGTGTGTAEPAVPAAPAANAPEANTPFPAIPTSPVPVPPGTEVSPPPMEPVQPGAAAPAIHVGIQYRRTAPGAEGEARRMAALLQNTGGSVELRPTTTTVRAPTITYYNADDQPAAAALAKVLANEASSWTIRLGTGKFPPGSLDIAMP